MSTMQDQIHSDAMKRSAAFYDLTVNTFTPPPLFEVNSLAPSWAIEGSVAEDGWGPLTEYVEYARAVSESYRFRPQYTLRKYPAQLENGEDTFTEVQSHETRSLVFKTIPYQEDYACQFHFGAHVLDPMSKKIISIKDQQDRLDDAQCEYALGEVVKQDTDSKGKRLPFIRYRLVAEDDLNQTYADYLSGVKGSEDVLDDIYHFVGRKMEWGSKEFRLRERGENLLSTFWEKMIPAVRTKQYEGKKPDSRFSHYVNSAWRNHRNGGYRDLKKNDEKFTSSTLQDKDETDVDGNVSREAVLMEDRHALQVHEQSKRLPTLENQIRCKELLAGLNSNDRAMAEDLMAAESESEAGSRVKMSRHQIYRAKKKLKLKLVRVGLRRNSKMVA